MAIAQKMICSLALAASSLLAQAPMNLVRVTAAALDSAGQPVVDLKAGDFQVTDQGKPQTIVFLRGTNRAPLAAPLAPHEYSNRTGAASPHATAILFDLLNESQPDRLNAARKIGRSLQQLESGEGIYLYLLTLEGNLTAVHAIGGKAGDDRTWTQQAEKTVDKAMKAASRVRPVEMNDQELGVKKTYVALETLGNQLATLPGHRDIVWITNGMPNVWNPKTPCNGDWVDCALYVPHLSVTLERDNVAVSPLSYTSSPSPDMTRDLEQLSGLTGGWTYMGEDFDAVLKQVAQDASSTYTIYYEAPPDNWDSKFHKVRLSVERKGLKLHAKQRYYAYPDPKPEARQQAALVAAYQSAFDDPGIGLRATLAAGSGAGKSVHVQIRINPLDLLLREKDGSFSGAVTLVLGSLGASGAIGEPALSNFDVHLTREQHDALMKEGLPIAQDRAINESVEKARVTVLDQGSNAVGSLTVPISPQDRGAAP